MLNASLLTGGFVVIAVGARYLFGESPCRRSAHHVAHGDRTDRGAGAAAAFHRRPAWADTLEHQPVKIAAIEGHWDSSEPGAFEIFAWPDEKTESNLFSISIPHASSLILTHRWDGLFTRPQGCAAARSAAAGERLFRLPHHAAWAPRERWKGNRTNRWRRWPGRRGRSYPSGRRVYSTPTIIFRRPKVALMVLGIA